MADFPVSYVFGLNLRSKSLAQVKQAHTANKGYNITCKYHSLIKANVIINMQ